MKKFIAIALLASSTFVSAQGFNGGMQINTVQAALKAADDMPVQIEGYLVRQINHEDFIFKDVAGQEIEVEIDDDAWQGQNINPTDKIVIQGSVDKNYLFSNKIDVDLITKP